MLRHSLTHEATQTGEPSAQRDFGQNLLLTFLLQTHSYATAPIGTKIAKLKGMAAQRRPCPKPQDLPRLRQKLESSPVHAAQASQPWTWVLATGHSVVAVPGSPAVRGLGRGSLCRAAPAQSTLRICLQPTSRRQDFLSPGMPLIRAAVAAAANDLDR